ncbi:MAG: AAA family ATPase [Bacteroidales bacterium]|nr:AAA family ATPase [Bacteroidales bacterium]
MEQLFQIYTDILKRTDTTFVRYLHGKINWLSRLIVIVGARGVGKTTMLLQHIKISNATSKSLYISADNTFFSAHSLYDTADKFHKLGGRFLYIDEAHKYKNWSQEVKMMYDTLPDLNIVVTGSSILDIGKSTDADLSRRAIRYTMEGMSFREYINMTRKVNIKAYSFDEIINHEVNLPEEIAHPLPLWNEYISRGSYPFFAMDDYYSRIDNVVNQTLEVDIPAFAGMNATTSRKLKKLLFVIAQSSPFKPNLSEIGRAIECDRSTVSDYIVYMEKAGLLRQLRTAGNGMSLIERPEKLFLANTTLIHALGEDKPNIGNIRETAFFALMSVNNTVKASPVSDFLVSGKTFEVGGKSKTQRQIKDTPDSYIVKDDIENGYLNVIPLWNFGMNY